MRRGAFREGRAISAPCIDTSRRPNGTGWTTIKTIKCAVCDVSQSWIDTSKAHPDPNVHAKTHFTASGWKKVDTTRAACPLHNVKAAPKPTITNHKGEAMKAAAQFTNAVNVGGPRVATPADIAAAVGEPLATIRKATREENGRIQDELCACYDDKAGRYKGTGSDAVLAESLGLPRAFVAFVRDAFFGPDVNEAQAKGVEDLAEIVKRCRGMEDGFMKAAADVEAFRRQAEAALKAIGK